MEILELGHPYFFICDVIDTLETFETPINHGTDYFLIPGPCGICGPLKCVIHHYHFSDSKSKILIRKMSLVFSSLTFKSCSNT